MTMSVIAEDVGRKSVFAYVKGAPENVLKVCSSNNPQWYGPSCRPVRSAGLLCFGFGAEAVLNGNKHKIGMQ